ncbi:hypothetical protein CPB86DRAFT_743567 [Serendipita vermifera]|nr:hypothetical protein CPB86DRAFT_743567 [Serendipita vermifera]
MAENVNQKQSEHSRAKNCAECRRLKIKCDREIPCSNCVKRGRASICPDGHLLPKGQRFILSNTEQLHARIDELTERIRELEEALANLQSLHSDEPHPLLKDSTEPLATAFGSLRLHDDGNARFYGGTSSMEWLMSNDRPEIDHTVQSDPFSDVSQSINPLGDAGGLDFVNASFPLPPTTDTLNTQLLTLHVWNGLPPKEEAIKLVEAFFSQSAMRIAPIRRNPFVNGVFTILYDGGDKGRITVQELSIVYGVFALGMLNRDNYAAAHRYITLSRGCLALDSVISHTTLTGIHAMLLQIEYLFTSDISYAYGTAQACLGMTMKLAQSIGLHRDPSTWGLPPEETYLRRLTMVWFSFFA